MESTADRRARPNPIAVGLTLVFAPIALLVAVYTATGSAVWASVLALSFSPALQMGAERLRPERALRPTTAHQIGVEAFQGIVYGTVFGFGTAFGLWWLLLRTRHAVGIEATLGLDPWLPALALVVLADFLDYFRHRHEHESNGLMWRVHSVHHSIRQFSLLSGLALHPLEAVFTYVSYGLVAGLLGLSFDSMLLGLTLALLVMGAQHTNTPTSLGRLSRVLAHADGHRWHHDIALGAGRNVNYANVLSLWDLLWGSFHAPHPFAGEYGIDPFRDAYPKGLVGQASMAIASCYAEREAACAPVRNPSRPPA